MTDKHIVFKENYEYDPGGGVDGCEEGYKVVEAVGMRDSLRGMKADFDIGDDGFCRLKRLNTSFLSR